MVVALELSPEIMARVERAAAERNLDINSFALKAFVREIEDPAELEVRPTDYARLTRLLEEFQVDAGVEDLAHQHEHYLYGTPKQQDTLS